MIGDAIVSCLRYSAYRPTHWDHRHYRNVKLFSPFAFESSPAINIRSPLLLTVCKTFSISFRERERPSSLFSASRPAELFFPKQDFNSTQEPERDTFSSQDSKPSDHLLPGHDTTFVSHQQFANQQLSSRLLSRFQYARP